MKKSHFTLIPERGDGSAELKIGLRSASYLADHRLHGMAVLPGSFYIAAAAVLHREVFNTPAEVFENVQFEIPIVVSLSDTTVRIEITESPESVEYRFFEATKTHAREAPHLARLAVRRVPLDGRAATSTNASTGRPGENALTDLRGFYDTLRKNGNDYGPSFQRISSLRRSGSQWLGSISATCPTEVDEPAYLHPPVLDSMTQLLAPFMMDNRQTFILRSIERVEILNARLASSLLGVATVSARPASEASFAGDVLVTDESGEGQVRLTGVTFDLRSPGASTEPAPTRKVVVAANFTAEPIEDVLRFWGEYLGAPIEPHFAPYNQVFQELLDSRSDLHKNDGVANVVLVSLEEWARANAPALTSVTGETATQVFHGHRRYVLPNGLEIAHLNSYETAYLYREIFEDQTYLRHGIQLRDDAVVLDIGANIGLFSLFVMSRCSRASIYAFEPGPAAYEALKANCQAYVPGARTYNVGVAARSGSAAFAFYPDSSVFSGFHSDEALDRTAIQQVIENALRDAAVDPADAALHAGQLAAGRLQRISLECRLTTVSEIIRDNNLAKIDLLKIDAERSELEILAGIQAEDWNKIGQIVLEVHDQATLEQVEVLLAGHGYHCTREQESSLRGSALLNVYAVRGTIPEDTPDRFTSGDGDGRGYNPQRLERTTREFCGALQSFTNNSAVPLVLGFCPASPAADRDARFRSLLNDAEQQILQAADRRNIATVSSAYLKQHYRVENYYDPQNYRAAHVPYTLEGFGAIGTAISRRLFTLQRTPFKVIVLDCDNTLWRGVCGEDGPLGINIDAPHLALQDFMVTQMRAGMLLCLSSKNNEADVWAVFGGRPEMLLKREHVAAYRIDWNRKSDNLRSLAQELNVGLDSMIFVDDNAVECAEVRSNCPEVLVLEMPQEPGTWASFLAHSWAFDHLAATHEDETRTQMYRESQARETFRKQSLSFAEFLGGLQLNIRIDEPTSGQYGRIAQLTLRTNQFNLTTIRRQESEILSLLKNPQARCLAVQVVDRFGDYGLCGVVLYEARAERLAVDTLLLSCRVLGKGVEHAVLRDLGRRAVNANKEFVELAYAPTEKNAPVHAFLNSLSAVCVGTEGSSRIYSAQRLLDLQYNPDDPSSTGLREQSATPAVRAHSSAPLGALRSSERLQRIAAQLASVVQIAKVVEEYRLGPQSQPPAEMRQALGPEGILLDIWRRVLRKTQIGIHDNFFESGGTSLNAIRVVGMIQRELGQSLSLVSLFEYPTISSLAAHLRGPNPAADGATKAVERGRDRRYKIGRVRST